MWIFKHLVVLVLTFFGTGPLGVFCWDAQCYIYRFANNHFKYVLFSNYWFWNYLSPRNICDLGPSLTKLELRCCYRLPLCNSQLESYVGALEALYWWVQRINQSHQLKTSTAIILYQVVLRNITELIHFGYIYDKHKYIKNKSIHIHLETRKFVQYKQWSEWYTWCPDHKGYWCISNHMT